MTTLAIFKFTIGLLVLSVICVGFYHEKKIAAFEKRLFKIIKCFIKACIITIEQKYSDKHLSSDIIKISDTLSAEKSKEIIKRIA